MLEVKFLPVAHGDSIFIKISEENKSYVIVVDGGPAGSRERFFSELEKIDAIDLLVVTHIDNDHIKGIVKAFNSNKFKDIPIDKYWFNSGIMIADYLTGGLEVEVPSEYQIPLLDNAVIEKQAGVKEGKELHTYLKGNPNKWHESPIMTGQNHCLSNNTDIKLFVISPNEDSLKGLLDEWNTKDKQKDKQAGSGGGYDYEYPLKILVKQKWELDSGKPNGSSIAFIIDYKGYRFLFSADAHANVMVEGLKKYKELHSIEGAVKFDVVKLSHHGSAVNISSSLLDEIDCEHYVVCANASTAYFHPQKETFAKIVNYYQEKYPSKIVTFHFNHNLGYAREGKLKTIFSEQDKVDYPNFITKYPINDKDGCIVTISEDRLIYNTKEI